MSEIKRIRIGNDIKVKPVLTASEGGESIAWTDAVKKVMAVSYEHRQAIELPFVVAGGELKATFKAEAQRCLGRYHIVVVLNDGSTATWDSPAFILVKTTAEADAETLGLVAIEVSGTLQVSTGGGGGVWGAITGTLANQTDLANALAGKANTTDIPTADITANTAARHTHTNKTTLDGITPQRVVNWDGKYTKPSWGVPFNDLAGDTRGKIERAENLANRVLFIKNTDEVEMYLQEWENLRGSLAIVMMDGNAIEAICLLNIYEYDSQLMFTYGTNWMITEMTLEKLISDYPIGITWREFFDALIEEGCSSIATAEMISNCVFKNIDETLAGAKTFLKPIKIAAEEDSNEFYTLASNFDDEGVNILNLNGSNGEVRIQGVADPVTDTDAVNKGYADANLVHKSGNEQIAGMKVFEDGIETPSVGATDGAYIEFGTDEVAILNNDGEAVNINTADPTEDYHAASKGYVDTALSSKANSSSLGNLTALATTDKTSAVAAINEVQGGLAGKQNSADRITDTWASSTSKYPSTAAADARFVPKSLPLITKIPVTEAAAIDVNLNGNFRHLEIIMVNWKMDGDTPSVMFCNGSTAWDNLIHGSDGTNFIAYYTCGGASTASPIHISAHLTEDYAESVSAMARNGYYNGTFQRTIRPMAEQKYVTHLRFSIGGATTMQGTILIYGY